MKGMITNHSTMLGIVPKTFRVGLFDSLFMEDALLSN